MCVYLLVKSAVMYSIALHVLVTYHVCVCVCKCHSTRHKSLNTPHQYNTHTHPLFVIFKVSPSTQHPQRCPCVHICLYVCIYLPLAKDHDLFYNFSMNSHAHVCVCRFNEYWMIEGMGRISLLVACILIGIYVCLMCVFVCVNSQTRAVEY